LGKSYPAAKKRRETEPREIKILKVLEYTITPTVQKGGKTIPVANQSGVSFNTTSGRSDVLPSPVKKHETDTDADDKKIANRKKNMLKIGT